MRRATAALVLLLSAAFALAPLLSDPFAGFEAAGDLPIPQDEPPAEPAGWAFAIWLPIYAWLVLSAAFGLSARAEDGGWHRARGPLALSLAAGVPWIAVANASATGATALIWVMLVAAAGALLAAPREDRWLLRAPVGLYAGWLTAASCVALATVGAGWGLLLGPVGWAVLAVLLALGIALAVLRRAGGEPTYALAVAWALLGVAAQNGAERWGVTLLALGGIAALGLAAWRWRASSP